MHCPSGFITGLHAVFGRSNKGDRDSYDFKLKCGDKWGSWFGMWFSAETRKEDRRFECPSGLHVTGLEVKRGRIEMGDKDFFDFRLQCGGIWESYLGLRYAGHKETKGKECTGGQFAYGMKVTRGFVEKDDKDFYEFEINCKSMSDIPENLRATPKTDHLGLPDNVLLWTVADVKVWLQSLGLGEYCDAFNKNRLQGDVLFSLSEEHLVELGMKKMGDRLYFMEALQQLFESITGWSDQQLPMGGGGGAQSSYGYM